MKIGSTHSVSLPNQNARAVGLIRKLEEGTFKGASIDKLRDKFAHRLAATDTTGLTGLTEAADSVSVAPIGSGQLLNVLA